MRTVAVSACRGGPSRLTTPKARRSRPTARSLVTTTAANSGPPNSSVGGTMTSSEVLPQASAKAISHRVARAHRVFFHIADRIVQDNISRIGGCILCGFSALPSPSPLSSPSRERGNRFRGISSMGGLLRCPQDDRVAHDWDFTLSLKGEGTLCIPFAQ